MKSLPMLNEGELTLVVSYSLSSGEDIRVAIINAFHAANVDVFEKPTQLDDWINTDVIEAIHWSSDRPVYLSTRIWDHRLVITPEEVRIYTTMNLA